MTDSGSLPSDTPSDAVVVRDGRSHSSKGAREALGDGDCVFDGVKEADAVPVWLGERDGVDEALGVEVTLGVLEALDDCVPVLLRLRDCVAVAESERLCVTDAVLESEDVCDGVTVRVGDCVAVVLGLRLKDGLCVCERDLKKSAMRRLE
jgi:hypothetical protein